MCEDKEETVTTLVEKDVCHDVTEQKCQQSSRQSCYDVKVGVLNIVSLC